MYVIETRKLTKKFDSLVAVNKVSLRIEQGEIFGLLGPNGAGKTTTLSMLATIIKPTSGDGYVNGYSIKDEPSKVRSSIGMVFQDPSSDDLLSGRENLYLHALMYGVESSRINERIDDALRLVDLTNRQHEVMKRYSGGMRRRLEIARGLLHSPKILFLDEPTLGLDPQTRQHIWSYIQRLAKEKKVTIIITTHYMEEADMLCDRVAIIDHGKIAALDTPASLKKKLGGDVVRIKIKDPDVRALKRLGYIKSVKKENDGVTLTVNNSGKHLQEIMNRAGAVESVESRSPTLNDVFLYYTGSEIREDEEGEGGYFERMMHSGNR